MGLQRIIPNISRKKSISGEIYTAKKMYEGIQSHEEIKSNHTFFCKKRYDNKNSNSRQKQEIYAFLKGKY